MDSESPTHTTIASVGAGRMGRGIAITFALAGSDVCLIDIKERSDDEFAALCLLASTEIQTTLTMLSSLGLVDANRLDSILARIRYYSIHEGATVLGNADVIFEAVPETLDAKEPALSWVSQYARREAVVASTTSTILSDELQPFVTNPGRFLNAHWLNPAYLVPLVEVSPGNLTEPGIVRRLCKLLEKMGKVPVVCSASPGYIVPRIQALAMNEAARMVEEGVASVDDIDKATRYGFGFRFSILGLLEFIDWGGGDILYYASRYMTNAMNDERYASPAIIEANMKAGRLGLSSRQGFLDYSSFNVDEYQRARLSEFVSMLRHMDKMPLVMPVPEEIKPSSSDAPNNARGNKDAKDIVHRYLSAMENRDLGKAQAFLSEKFSMTFPGSRDFTALPELVAWSATRYKSIGKTIERFDQCQSEDNDTIVYCYGTLNGVWLNGTTFSDIRFVDRFVVADGLIRSQLVWNDLAESNT